MLHDVCVCVVLFSFDFYTSVEQMTAGLMIKKRLPISMFYYSSFTSRDGAKGYAAFFNVNCLHRSDPK